MALSRKTTAHEAWLHECAKKTFENTIPVLNDFLGKLLTLSTALIGGGFLIVKNEVMDKGFSVAALFIMLLSMTATIYGMLPVGDKMHSPFTNVSSFQAIEAKAINRKSA